MAGLQRIMHTVLVLALLGLAAGCATRSVYRGDWGASCPEDPNGAIIMRHDGGGACYSIRNPTPAFDKALQRIKDETDTKNIILFVHGRGPHPKKAFKQKLLKYLEEENDAVVIMFHWPSYNWPLGFPIKNAPLHAWELEAVFRAFSEYKKNHRVQFSPCRAGNAYCGVKSVLLVHSMGNMVVYELARSAPQAVDYDKKLFDTVVMVSGPAPSTNHDQWLKNIKLSEHQYVGINKNDWFIRYGGRLYLNDAVLGNCAKKPLAKEKETTYVNFTNLKIGHRFYINGENRLSINGKKGLFDKKPALREFMEKTLSGEPARQCSGPASCSDPIQLGKKDGNKKLRSIYCGER